ncbi:hemagglutinin/amebocyte aggregation factor [Elysia marginata]|uniref:Hemagglutinin/amebocyte aggregation factor n=1 Tax=Elysia marginata TaxID=1093978 RepID=A0AAV4ELB3_9GAST|nr:hemagglutinin/amebocyte aggregation factor [Elysia marginata]
MVRVKNMPSSRGVLTLLLSLAVVLSVTWADDQFDNAWDGPLNFECPAGEFISSVYSVHNNQREDRRWRLGCSAAPYGAIMPKCSWTEDYVNSWDEPISFMCPTDYAVAGIQSYHDNRFEDRRMKFKCCKPLAYKTLSCTLTPYLNEFDGELNYTVPNLRVLTGWFSVHQNRQEDRRHKMLTCLYRL